MRTIAADKARARGDLLRALGRLPADVPAPEPEPPKRTSLDGGARMSVTPAAPTHEETLLAILATRAADAGRTFGG
jgi:hypothetical protein